MPSGRRIHPQRHEKCERAGQLPQPVYVQPEREKDGIQIIPLSEVAAKDEFLNIKNVSRDDMMAAHRVPPQMMGIMPSNVGGFGDVEKASRVFVRNELIPLQKRFEEINTWLSYEIIKFKSYTLDLI